ncbi:hypothetical protein Q4553_00910 [Tenacibaculum soleae]|uniref:hypothetical protein n=1 Tax=Tenacibaculum soleae TaxID=447689 RepID=UPI0026E38DB0|nr:hypothetical protein [Tenacibaculum soleae]MDO6743123.1 hypothetical protein [Tenacibaculum soleae]
MKKSILELGKPLNKTAQRNITGGRKSHRLCKAEGISVAYTAAGIRGGEPRISDFMAKYKSCMGYN